MRTSTTTPHHHLFMATLVLIVVIVGCRSRQTTTSTHTIRRTIDTTITITLTGDTLEQQYPYSCHPTPYPSWRRNDTIIKKLRNITVRTLINNDDQLWQRIEVKDSTINKDIKLNQMQTTQISTTQPQPSNPRWQWLVVGILLGTLLIAMLSKL